ncbi:MAG TPA: acyltransferase [Terracidiphilus sp.]|jgi:acetyltransferase-like isoleucine patch superfamily enzyme
MSTSQQPVEPPYGNALKPSLRRRLATSQSFPARLLRWAYYTINNFSVPAPRIVVRPLLWVFLLVRNAYYFIARVFICEPYFKAFCTQYGRNLHTAAHLHWITGKGDIVIGDNVSIFGRIDIGFAARFSDHPMLRIGDNTGIGGGCVFTVGKLIEIGRNCNFSGSIQVMDSNGHDTDPTARWKHEAPLPEDVRPVFIRDNVWIGKNCIIFPGVKIGEGSVISAGSVVRSHVPPYAVVAGNPAKVIFRLKKPDPSTLA